MAARVIPRFVPQRARLPGPAAAAALVLLAIAVAGCSGTLKPLPPTPAPTPRPTPTLALRQTRVQLEAALRLAGFGLIDETLAFEPPVPTDLAAAPQAVFQIVLPADPDRGQIVAYDLGSPAAAAAAGRELAAFLAQGTTRVAFPADERHVLQQVGETLVFYTWSPSAMSDPGAPKAAAAVATVGETIPIAP